MSLNTPKRMLVDGDQERFLSPCYEQLRGCYYGLRMADTNGLSSGSRPDVTKLDLNPADDQAWRAGFYLDAS